MCLVFKEEMEVFVQVQCRKHTIFFTYRLSKISRMHVHRFYKLIMEKRVPFG